MKKSNQVESEQSFSDCIADEDCMRTFINIFFFSVVGLATFLILSAIWEWTVSLF